MRKPCSGLTVCDPLEPRRLLATFSVTTTADAGTGSLRAAVAQANALQGPDVITFAIPPLSTISLTTGELVVTDQLTVRGPAGAEINLNAQGLSRIFNVGSTSRTLTLENLALRNGFVGDSGGSPDQYAGGAVRIARANLVATRTRFFFNEAFGGGGAIASFGGALVETDRCTFAGNVSASDGGAVLVYGDYLDTGSGYADNVSSSYGGGLSIVPNDDAGSLQLTNTIFQNNVSLNGAGLNSTVGGVLTGVQFIGNAADTSAGQSSGGGANIYDFRPSPNLIQVIECDFLDNRGALGGGLTSGSEGELLIVRSRFAGNKLKPAGAAFPTVGGGLNLRGFASAQILESEIASNGLAEGIGDRDHPAELDFEGPNLLGVQLMSDPDAAGAIFSDDPELMPLDFYGGPTRTTPPEPKTQTNAGSPAYNAGSSDFAVDPGPDEIFGTADDVPLGSDQRNFPREIYGQVDLGAAEFVIQGDANLDGTVNLSDFVILRNNFGSGGLFSQGDFNGDGQVDLADFVLLRNNFGKSVVTVNE